jgi:hypothetical protein
MNAKVREIRLRHKAKRCGYRLAKCPRRDPDALGFGLYALVSLASGEPVNQPLASNFMHSWSLDCRGAS